MQSAIDRVGVGNARFYAQWSTVASPYGDPKYALPYGFVQSPILASLVVATSDLGQYLVGFTGPVKAAVYVDDISLSANDEAELRKAYKDTLAMIESDGFSVSASKLRPPASAIDIFNCDLSQGQAVVRDDRINDFLATGPSQAAEDAFAAYCASVEDGNQP